MVVNKEFQNKNHKKESTWAMRVKDTKKLKRTEASLMRRMCGVSQSVCEAVRRRLEIDGKSDTGRHVVDLGGLVMLDEKATSGYRKEMHGSKDGLYNNNIQNLFIAQ